MGFYRNPWTACDHYCERLYQNEGTAEVKELVSTTEVIGEEEPDIFFKKEKRWMRSENTKLWVIMVSQEQKNGMIQNLCNLIWGKKIFLLNGVRRLHFIP